MDSTADSSSRDGDDACSLASCSSYDASRPHDSDLIANFSSLQCDIRNSTHDGSAYSEASYLMKLMPAPKKICLLGNLSEDDVPSCIKKLDVPVASNFLMNGKLPSDSSGVIIFITDDYSALDAPPFPYLTELMSNQSATWSSGPPGEQQLLIQSPGIVRVGSVQVLEELWARFKTAEEVLKEIIVFKRPIFSLALHKARFAFTGFTHKDYVRYLTRLVHRMGGSVMQDADSTTTHLVAKKTSGTKYQYCKTYNIPVIKKEWVEALWEAAKTGSKERIKMEDYFCPLFHELRVGFCGFSQEKLAEFKATLETSGGKMVRPDAERVDFIVMNEATVLDAPMPSVNPKAVLVTESWFWESVVQGVVIADEYLFKPPRPDMSCKSPSMESNRSMAEQNSLLAPPSSGSSSGLAVEHPGATKTRRRSFLSLKSDKKRKDELGRSPMKPDIVIDPDSGQGDEKAEAESVDALSGRSLGKLVSKKSLLANGDQSVGSIGDINLTSESFGDPASTSSSQLQPDANVPRAPTARRQVFCELLQTEKNYVQVLDLIKKAGSDWRRQEMEAREKRFKASSEAVNSLTLSHNRSTQELNQSQNLQQTPQHSHNHTLTHSFQENGPDSSSSNEQTFDSRILDKLLANVIPLQKIHGRLLAALQALDANWDENARVASAIVEELGREDVIHAYKIYVKDVDLQKSQLRGLSDKYPRFHAYLRAIALKPEYKRQSLDELLIRPVQRLPSMMLLLKDLRKRTSPHLHDYSELNKALEIVNMTTSKINEERRIFDQQREILLKMYEIEDCPPDLLSWSAGRSLISDYDVVDLNNMTGKKGSPLVLFFFTDVLLICKRRSGRMGANILRSSPSVASLHNESGIDGVNPNHKPYKFLCCLELRYIKGLLDLRFSGRDLEIQNLVQEGTFGLYIQRDGESDQTNYVFHVFRGGPSSSGAPPQSPASTLDNRNHQQGGVSNGLGMASGALTGSTLSLSEIACKSEGPKKELLRLLSENVVRQTFQDPSNLIQVVDVSLFNVDPHHFPRLISMASSTSSNPFHRMTRKMSFRSGSSSSGTTGGGGGGGATTPLKRSYSTITPSSAPGSAYGGMCGAPSAKMTPSSASATISESSAKNMNPSTSTRDGTATTGERHEEFLAPLPPSSSFAKPSPYKKPGPGGGALRKQFSKFTAFAFSRTNSSSSNS